jgi:magnesium transporter
VAGRQRRRPDDHRLRVRARGAHGGDVIERIRSVAKTEAETVYYVYVVSARAEPAARRRSLRDLLARPRSQSVDEVMTENVFKVSPETDQEEVARMMAKYDFYALPVVGAIGSCSA